VGDWGTGGNKSSPSDIAMKAGYDNNGILKYVNFCLHIAITLNKRYY
jgi:hypothetical protein